MLLNFIFISITLILNSHCGRDFNLIIAHTNDLEGHYDNSENRWHCEKETNACNGGFARLSYVLTLFRKQANKVDIPFLYLDSGNNIAGTAWFSLFGIKLAAKMMNNLAPDATSIGNFEFYNGENTFAQYLEEIEFPVISANIDTTKNELFDGLWIPRSIVKTYGDVKVGIVGYSDSAVMMKAPLKNISFIDVEYALRMEVKRLKMHKVDIVIALGQAGIWKDKELASRIPDLDVIIGGNSQSFLQTNKNPNSSGTVEPYGPYPIVVIQKSGRYVPVVQAFENGKYIGVLRIKFNKNENSLTFSGNTFQLHAGIPQDPYVTDILENYLSTLKKEKENIIGYSKVKLECYLCDLAECNIGNLATDAMIEFYARHYYGHYWTNAPVALLSGAVFRRSIMGIKIPIPITEEDIDSAIPELYIFRCSIYGDHLIEALNSAISAFKRNTGKFIQLSGLKISINMEREQPPFITDIRIRCAICRNIDYYPIEHTFVYTLLLHEFELYKGDAFIELEKYLFDCVAIERFIPNATVGNAVKSYIRHRVVIYPVTGDRFTYDTGENLPPQEH